MIRVLIVEDEPLIAEAHQAYLARVGGYEVVAVVSTARDAVRQASAAAAEEKQSDMVLLDVELPDNRGITIASPGPITLVDGLMKMSGSGGRGLPCSAACAR